MLATRGKHINVYYRGGVILKLTEKRNGYEASFDEKYTRGQVLPLPLSLLAPIKKIISGSDMHKWVNSFSFRKSAMDSFFMHHKTLEREFRQLVVRENNFPPLSNKTAYFIVDIELAAMKQCGRFDMLAFKWPSADRKTDEVQLVLIEMKYADNALEGVSGIMNHLLQFEKFLRDSESLKNLRDMARGQINQHNRLRLIEHTRKENRDFEIAKDKIECVFLFANHNPGSLILRKILKSSDFSSVVSRLEPYCNIRFFIANSAGYGMYEKCMVDLHAYLDRVK
jgi:hypothetical protein